MNSAYLTDAEYQSYWFRLEGMRKKIAENLVLKTEMKILDVGTGWGFFALEMAKRIEEGEIIGIDIVDEDIERARKLVKEDELENIISIQRMDATKLSFPDNYFDFVTSFLGMRDIHMTRGRIGVKKAVEEMIRVVNPRGKIVLCVTPPEDMETEDQKLAVKLEGDIFGAKSMPKQFYIDIFEENNAILTETRVYLTNKKLTAGQAKIELEDGLAIARKIYGIKVSSIREVWDNYGKRMETFGYGMYSKIVMLLALKLQS